MLLAHNGLANNYWATWFPGAMVAVMAVFAGVWRLSAKANNIVAKVDELDRKVNTNHGKTIGEHVEDAARAASQVATDLSEYKLQQATADQREHELVEGYVAADAAAHTEMRALIMQVALEKPPPASP